MGVQKKKRRGSLSPRISNCFAVNIYSINSNIKKKHRHATKCSFKNIGEGLVGSQDDIIVKWEALYLLLRAGYGERKKKKGKTQLLFSF